MPEERPWKDFRACLRWDFGFTCPFCMLHEADLSEHGADGEATVWIEHFVARSRDASRVDDYSNTLLSCKFCNQSKGIKPVRDDLGRNLLDPTRDAWSEHFEWQVDHLRPKAGDADAEYTYSAYKLDQTQKLARRVYRRERITKHCRLLDKLPALIRRRNQEAQDARRAGDRDAARAKLDEIRELRHVLACSADELKRYAMVPKDAPARCICGNITCRNLPAWLSRQALELAPP